MTLALYRKYRPDKLADLLGQETTREILQNAAKQDKFAHAYLFYGPRGTGKTTTARLIAKLANCEKRSSDKKFASQGEPCNTCGHCAEIESGKSLDVMEIDAASNRGIDEIRNLQEGVRLSPISSPYKVYIIDEVHMLTREAFNALLKTLEEPPAHAIFILATTEYEKVPPTITSRVQRFAFRRLPKNIIIEKLESICEQEKIAYDKDALEIIAVAAEGSVRDAESLLDQLWSSIGKIEAKNVEEALGRVGLTRLYNFGILLINYDLPKSLEYITELGDTGVNLVQFNKDLIHYLRRVLSLKLNPQLATLFEKELTADDIKKLKELGEKGNETFLIAMLKSLIHAHSEMRYSPFAIVPLEVAVIENLKK